MYLLIVILKWWFLHLVSYFHLVSLFLVSCLSCVDLVLWYNLDNLMWCHTFVCLLGLLGVLSKLYLLVSWKSWACIFTICTLFGMLSFLVPIYRGNSTKSQIGWDVHGIQFHIYMHIFMWSLSYVLVFLTLWSQWVWVPVCSCGCSRNNWRCIGCSAHSQGRWCHRVLIGVKLGWSMNYYLLHHSNAISVTSIIIYFMHTFLRSTMCRLHHGMNIILSCDTCFLLKASQQWSLVASCDVFDVMFGVHWYTIRQY